MPRWTATTNTSKPAQLSLMGCPQLTAGNKIELSDFGVLSGQWLIDKSMHKLTRSGGYTTEIDISRGPATSQ